MVTEYFKYFSLRKVGLVLGLDKSRVFRILHSPTGEAKIQQEFLRQDVTVERVRSELTKLAFFDPREFYTDDGGLVPIHQLDDAASAALMGVEVSEIFEGVGKDRRHVGYLKKIKHADKGQNLERLGRYLKMFTDQVNVDFSSPPTVNINFIQPEEKDQK